MRADMERRIGVYVCHCGLNIAGTVDVEKVAEYAGGLDSTSSILINCSQASL